jgi:hypothetical protein
VKRASFSLVFLLSSACSSASFSEVAGDAGDAGDDTATTSASDASSESGATGDATVTDASGGEVGAPDAISPPDAEPPPDGVVTSHWCASAGKHSFCADFDESTDLAAGWTANKMGGGLELFTTVAKSPPNAALLGVGVRASTDGGAPPDEYSYLQWTSPFGAINTVTLEADINVIPHSFPSSSTGFVQYAAIGPSADHGVALGESADGLEVRVYASSGASMQFPAGAAPLGGGYVHLRFAVTVDKLTSTGSFALAIGSAPTVMQSTHTFTTLGTVGVQIGAGNVGADPTPALSLDFDNVTIDVE